MKDSLARFIYFSLQYLRQEPVAEALKDVIKTEFVSEEELKSIQSKRQLEQLKFCVEHIPYYREALKKFHSEIFLCKNWKETKTLMEGLPVLEKKQVFDRFRDLHSEKKELKTHPDKTSGSSGNPLIFPCDQKSWAYRHALFYRCAQSFGVKIGEPYALFFGLHWSKRSRIQIGFRDWIFNRVRVSAYDISETTFMPYLKKIFLHRPTHFLGYPSAIYEFCVLLKARGIDLKPLKLKAVFLTAEPLRDYQKKLIEEVTESKCVDFYGSAEGGMMAFQCPAGSLHLTSEATWLQTRPSEQGMGEVIITDMMLQSFPLIRYAQGDEVRLKTGKCVCGRSHPMIESIEGRSGEPIILPNGKRINANLPSYIFKSIASYGAVRRYRFVQKENRIFLYLVVSDKFSEKIEKIICNETEKAFGKDISVTIKIVADLPQLVNAKHKDFLVQT